MKKLSILLLALASGSVMAHSHMPQQYGGKDKPDEAVTFTGVKVVPIRVGNLSSKPTAYEITINGEKVNETGTLGTDVFQTLHVPVKLSEPNKPEMFKICSTSIVEPNTVSYRTRICTYAKLIWSKK